ncbi:hypothetical protein H5410_048795 [Solanum commersonii]|uniref:S-protein homolog n=1 Tax=Solanum commersonii TaxID=4109 RepID=A0A9J5XJ65_SOLCO|nr:hypothetical protein H5410_048795 [Solanum commersonii]
MHHSNKVQENDDLGYHYPAVNEDFNWEFCEFIMDRTLFFCHIWWGSNDRSFIVYNDPVYCVKTGKFTNYLHYCKWEVRADGFYLENYNDTSKTYFMDHIFDWKL